MRAADHALFCEKRVESGRLAAEAIRSATNESRDEYRDIVDVLECPAGLTAGGSHPCLTVLEGSEV